EIREHSQIVERVDLAGDGERHRPHLGCQDRIGRDETRKGPHSLEILDDRKRLRENGSVIELERRNEPLRIERAESVGPLLSAPFEEMNGSMLDSEALEIERDADPICSGAPEIPVKLHRCSSPLRPSAPSSASTPRSSASAAFTSMLPSSFS